MNKVLVALFLFTSYTSFAQIDSVYILVGRGEKNITDYFNFLNSQKNNPYYKIKKSVTPQGDLSLEVEFSLEDESYYKCTFIMAIFQRMEGKEYCIDQLISGDIQYANHYLSFIKDNFKSISQNTWEKNHPDIVGLKIVASFNKIEDDYFSVIFSLREAK